MNKIIKIIDGIVWVLAIVGMISLVVSYIELREIQKDVRELKSQLSKTK